MSLISKLLMSKGNSYEVTINKYFFNEVTILHQLKGQCHRRELEKLAVRQSCKLGVKNEESSLCVKQTKVDVMFNEGLQVVCIRQPPLSPRPPLGTPLIKW